MDCAAEESEIRRAVEGISGIRALTFQLGQRSLALDAPGPALELAVAAIRKAGFDPQPMVEGKPGAAPDHTADDGHDHGKDHAFGPAGYGRLGMALLLAIAAELVGYFAPDTQIWKGAGLAVAAAAIWLAGFDVYKKGLTALLRGRLNINALMTVAVTGAFAIGQWPEAAMVMALYAIAEAIEARAVDRARNAIKGLLEMAPEEAAVRQADGTWLTQPVASVALDAVLQVRPGERVPMDGVLTGRQHQHQSGTRHGREHPGGQGCGRPGVCRHDQRHRQLRVPRHGAGLELDPGTHHPCG
jgi:Cd2+/Zn2+-exporting ATPase